MVEHAGPRIIIVDEDLAIDIAVRSEVLTIGEAGPRYLARGACQRQAVRADRGSRRFRARSHVLHFGNDGPP